MGEDNTTTARKPWSGDASAPEGEALARAYIREVRRAQKNPCYECKLLRCPDCGMECLPFETYCVKCGAGKFIHTLRGVPLNEKVIERAKQIWMAEVVIGADALGEPGWCGESGESRRCIRCGCLYDPHRSHVCPAPTHGGSGEQVLLRITLTLRR